MGPVPWRERLHDWYFRQLCKIFGHWWVQVGSGDCFTPEQYFCPRCVTYHLVETAPAHINCRCSLEPGG